MDSGDCDFADTMKGVPYASVETENGGTEQEPSGSVSCSDRVLRILLPQPVALCGEEAKFEVQRVNRGGAFRDLMPGGEHSRHHPH
jgi:hypothetical protein